jgi:hypothetical protein
MPRGRKMAMSSALIYTSRKLVRYTGKLLKIKSKLILIPFVEYVFFIFFIIIFLRINPTFGLKK